MVAGWYDRAVGLFQVGGFLAIGSHRQATPIRQLHIAIDKPASAATRLSNCTHPSSWGSSRRFCPTCTLRRVDATGKASQPLRLSPHPLRRRRIPQLPRCVGCLRPVRPGCSDGSHRRPPPPGLGVDFCPSDMRHVSFFVSRFSLLLLLEFVS